MFNIFIVTLYVFGLAGAIYGLCENNLLEAAMNVAGLATAGALHAFKIKVDDFAKMKV